MRFLLQTANDVSRAQLVLFKRTEPQKTRVFEMTISAQTSMQIEWTAIADFPEEAHYIKYDFIVMDREGNAVFFCEHGLSKEAPQDGFFEVLQINESDIIAPPEWARGIVYYQIFPERFARGGVRDEKGLESWNAKSTADNYLGGDLRGIIGRLDYLAELGAECLYLNPVFRGDFNHKYATTDYFSVDPDFGTEEDLKELVRQANEKGIRVLLDGVFNHCGVHFAPFEDVCRNGEASEYADWFHIKHYPVEINSACYECVGDYPYMPRLNTSNPAVQAYILKIMRFWIETAKIDGWRLDVADELDGDCLRYLRRNLKCEFPDTLLLAETWGDASRMIVENDQADCAMNYLFRDDALDYFAHSSICESTFNDRINALLMKYPQENMLCMYNCLGSHDTPRLLTECGGDLRRAKLAMAFQMLFIGSPALYYGDETGMTGENDPGCRGGMNWDSPDTELYAWVQRLIQIRKTHLAVRNGAYRTLLADDARKLFAFERRNEKERVVVVFNTGGSAQHVDFADTAERIEIRPQSVEIRFYQGGKPNA